MTIFTRIETEYVASCPSCKQWLWKVGPNSGFFGKAPLETATRYIASDGDTVPFVEEPPAPLTAYTEYDATLLKGECPHCGDGYWFVTASYPEVPVSNGPRGGPAGFICDEGRIEITDRVEGAFIGDPAVTDTWVQMRQSARWDGRDIRVDVHMIGPFSGGDDLVGSIGVSSCGMAAGNESRRTIWETAADLVKAVTPAAIDSMRARSTTP
ncbi:hypothetical protein BOSEA31B_20698 [Hyphomicrobiales bacterium]|jgi:hypothetical protein|nr:hypothetical protein BOSEA31B_20698 [Hyphomicrobiales bacterium]CAH1702806.1 hypothetical protein BOSEA1005_30678 [Hyphomicrobiales bacterium]CAI0346995.1 hypothetical protein BO1005MUT1_530171 [Hyphomicrobiales bacterium]